MKSFFSYNKRIMFSITLILMGTMMPLWLSADAVDLHSLMEKLSENPNGNTLMLTAILLVMLNTFRALPHYLGALLLGDELSVRLERPWLKVAIPIVVIPFVYFFINLYNPLRYHFGGPAILLVCSIIVLQFISNGNLRPVLKGFILIQLIFGLQWLDVVVWLTPFGFGGGPISSELKIIASQIGMDSALSFYSLLLCCVFTINTLVLVIYLTVSEQKTLMKHNLHLARGEIIESRSGREALHLVHDLKTPLALIEGLNSLIQLKTKDKAILAYTERISNSIESTSNMVSEILYKDKKNWCSLKLLIGYVRANKLSYSDIHFHFELGAGEQTEIFINKIRMTRAIINLIDNACDAVEGIQDAHITIHTAEDKQHVKLGVEDNGKGMTHKEQKNILRAGYSTKAHPGVGLTFVKNVVEEHDATLHISSSKQIGTIIWIKLPKECVRHEHTNYR